MPNIIKNQIGDKLNSLTLLKRVNRTHGVFQCDCGKEKIIRISNVFNIWNQVKTCGDRIVHPRGKHGHRKKYNRLGNKVFQAWLNMKKRCLNSNHTSYEDYGGRGITICKRWLDSYSNFFDDMGFPEDKDYSLDRIDNNGSYCKENCRWTDKKTQQNNRRVNNKLPIMADRG
jgi:hypothetical protein